MRRKRRKRKLKKKQKIKGCSLGYYGKCLREFSKEFVILLFWLGRRSPMDESS